MLKDEINSMLSSLMSNKRAFKKFYKAGYCSYSKDRPFEGAVAIVNNKSIVSFLQNAYNENEVIATASFQDNTTFVFQLMDDDYSQTQFGYLLHRCSSNRRSVIKDISSVRRFCAEAEERLISSSPHFFIKSIFSKTSQSSDKLSKQDVRLLLQTTLDKLHETQYLNNRNEISPKVESINFTPNITSNIIHPSIDDKTPEI